MQDFTMSKICFLILAIVMFAVGRRNPEPPETNFFLVNIPYSSGFQISVVFFTDSFSKIPEPLCLNEDPKSSDVSHLAHMICTASKFPTFLETSLVKPSSVLSYRLETPSALSCHQDEFYEIVCNRSSSSPGPCSLLQVTCGACHHHVQLKPSSSLQLKSPLYPVLQPGLVCQFDLLLPQDISADISIEIADLSLDQAKSSHSGEHCVNSFVHILSGSTFLELRSIATLCGDVVYPGMSSFFKVTNSVVRLLLVGGSNSRALGKRGFLVNVYVSPSRIKIPLYKLVILLSFFGFLVLILVILALVILYLSRKSKTRQSRPRRRQTWHGSVPRAGEIRHQNRTERIRRLGNTSWGSDNLYMFDNRFSRRLPTLPAFNSSGNDQKQQTVAEDPGFKLYETLSLTSRSSSHTIPRDETPKKKCATSSSQCPPPVPSRPSPTIEDPCNSPVYLTLPAVYSDTWSQAGSSGDTPTDVAAEAASVKEQGIECKVETSCSEEKQNQEHFSD
eukprot:GFUD01043229.1.p1 GENE.GFUD01043229.1~~GFUD01043229.1.p1  ORF type:complete len:504 (-),score=81.26 GFUD01043229.1:104-1615(-)